MKLIIVLMTTCLMQVTAATFAQNLTYSKKGASLEEIFREIKKQTGYNVLYSPEKIDDTKKIDVYFKDTALPEVLEKVVSGQALEYTINDKNISLKPKDPTFLDRLAKRWANIDIVGRVIDEQGKSLPGASVKVKATGKAVSTDGNGKFFLRGVEEGAVLVVSFIGYLPKEVRASANMGDVVLEQSLSKLDEIQVIAYGTTTRRLSTGNISTVKAEDIEKQPVNNPLLALQGRVPGLFIEQQTGFAGTGVKVRIQGTNSMTQGNDPLYVIDGMPYTSQLNPGGNSILGFTENSAGNPLNFINPLDIESIDVLKDADATAIYGSRAANGAILITTKKGKAGDIRFDANLQNGWGNVTRKLDLMNGQQYLEMRREALKNDGITAAPGTYGDSDLNGNWDNTRNTDWQKELIGGTAQYRDFNASVSGGSDIATFLVGGNYHKETNVFPGDFADTKGSVHFSVNGRSKDQKFGVQFSGSYLADNNLLPNGDLTQQAMQLAPVAPNLFNTDGSLNWQLDDSGLSTFGNPLSYIYSKNENRTNNLIANGVLGYRFFKGFEFKTNLGYSNLQSNSLSYMAMDGYSPADRPNVIRNSLFGNSKTDSWIIEPQINYNRTIWSGKMEVLLGTTIQRDNRQSSILYAEGFPTDQAMEDIKSATSLQSTSSLNSVYKYNALFGRVNYNWQDKYIINLTARRDGSSRFGSENRFHNFGAIGLAWIFSEEPLLKESVRFLSYGKLSGSYGTTGNDKIPDYNFLSLYNVVNSSLPYQGTNGYKPSGLTNPYLQWEETRKLKIGLDLGFFKDRIFLNMNYSNNISSNQLLRFALPIQTGFSSIQSNFPATVKNTGFEFTVSSTNLNTSNFKWSSSFNLTIPRNKLVDFVDLKKSPYASQYVIGKSVNIIKMYRFNGVDPETGAYQFSNDQGRSILNPVPASAVSDNDQFVIVNPDPKFYGGFQNTFSYKGFELEFLFQFTKQSGYNYFLGRTINFFNGGAFNLNFPVWLTDRWQKPGDNAIAAKYSTNISISTLNASTYSNANWGDASYIRLKNLSLSWKLPQQWKTAIHVRDCKVFLQGQNLLTITNYLGLDPETKSSLSLPPLRVITMGVKVGL